MGTASKWHLPSADADSGAVSIYQVVAYNLREARRERRLTQDQLGERLEELTGRAWSRATVSAAESGWHAAPDRVRQFDVSEVAAFALALRLPITWFFLPPPTTPEGATPGEGNPWVSIKGDASRALTSELLLMMTLTQSDEEDPEQLMARRLRRQGVSGPSLDPEVLGQLYELVVQLLVQSGAWGKEGAE